LKVAIPRFGKEVAPCFEYSATITIFTIKKGRPTGQVDFTVQSPEAFDRVRLLRDQDVDTLICGGVQDVFEDLLRGTGINVISWISGTVEEVLERFIHGRLVPGTGRLGTKIDGPQPSAANGTVHHEGE
jgi:predicted Fe-Mo cluster-binding NifX family protein